MTSTSDVSTNEPLLSVSFACRLVKLGVPLSAQAILSFSATLVSMSFIGHIGKHELSAAVLGTSLFNVTGLSILIGLCSAMETLSGQVLHINLLLLPRLPAMAALAICIHGVKVQSDGLSAWSSRAELWSQELQRPWDHSAASTAGNGSSQRSDHCFLDTDGQAAYLVR